MYNIFDDVKGRHNINKLAIFLKELHDDNLCNSEIEKYKNRLNDGEFSIAS